MSGDFARCITVERLIAAGIAPTQARAFAEPLAMACERFGIDTPARIGAFVAQCSIESEGFTRLEENLYYTTPERILQVFPSRVQTMAQAQALARKPKALANCVYARRLGNGDEASGDGWRFRGRGCLGLTGRENYVRASVELSLPFVDWPDVVALPPDACLTAAWYWHKNGLSQLADAGRYNEITRRINGAAMLKAIARKLAMQESERAFS